MKNKAVFLDRDGIIIQLVNGEAPQKTSEMFLIKEIVNLLCKTKKFGYLNIVITNQPDIALGKINETIKKAIEKKFIRMMKVNKLIIDDVYICNHHENAIVSKYKKDCNCRKPKSGMILSAMKKWKIDPKKSFTLGDRASDIKAGKTANTKTILFDKNNTQKEYLKFHKIKPDYKINKLSEATYIICKQ